MPVPASGELKLRADIALEVDGSASGTNVSLGTLSDTAGFDTPPDAMSEFYGYVSYVQPTTTGSPTTSNVFDVRMDVASTTFTNSSAGSVTRGFYFGTSSTMASNTFYDEGTTSSTSFSFSKQFTGLSGGTTYYMWSIIKDSQSPARFTQTESGMKTQATLAAISYSTGWGSAQNLNGSEMAGAGSYTGAGMSGSVGSSYNHAYYGWSGLSGGTSASMTHTGAAAWEGYSSYPNVTRYWGWRTDGVTTQNRANEYCSATGTLTGYAGQARANHSMYSIQGNGSALLVSVTCSGSCGSNKYENWASPPSSGSSGGYYETQVNYGAHTLTGYVINAI
jgi:hypothetical protein